MQENIRSELFFLKQFGFNDILLQHIFLSGLDPIQVIFKKDIDLEINLEDLFLKRKKDIK